MQLWIPHGGCDGNPVSFWRWALYKFSHAVNWAAEMLHEWAFDLEFRAVYQRPRSSMWDDDEIPF